MITEATNIEVRTYFSPIFLTKARTFFPPKRKFHSFSIGRAILLKFHSFSIYGISFSKFHSFFQNSIACTNPVLTWSCALYRLSYRAPLLKSKFNSCTMSFSYIKLIVKMFVFFSVLHSRLVHSFLTLDWNKTLWTSLHSY